MQEIYQLSTHLALLQQYPSAQIHQWHASVLQALREDRLPLLQLQRMALLRLLKVRRTPRGYVASDYPFCHGPAMDLSVHLGGACRAFYLIRVGMYMALLCRVARVTTLWPGNQQRGLAVRGAIGAVYTIVDSFLPPNPPRAAWD